jgi:hypothetical protein
VQNTYTRCGHSIRLVRPPIVVRCKFLLIDYPSSPMSWLLLFHQLADDANIDLRFHAMIVTANLALDILRIVDQTARQVAGNSTSHCPGQPRNLTHSNLSIVVSSQSNIVCPSLCIMFLSLLTLSKPPVDPHIDNICPGCQSRARTGR